MTEISQLSKKNDRTFILVCLNFIMLFVLFCGSGYVLWQSATLIDALREDLAKAEKTVADLKGRIREMDVDLVVDRMTEAAVGKLGESVTSAVEGADFLARMQKISTKVDTAQDRLEQTADSVSAMNEKLQQLDAERLGQAVSYHMLKGLGEGFTQAAETRNPLADD